MPDVYIGANHACASGDCPHNHANECLPELVKELRVGTARIRELERDLVSARNEAVCHCGSLMHEHTMLDNHSPVALKHPCPNVARIRDLERKVAELRDLVLKLQGHMDKGCTP